MSSTEIAINSRFGMWTVTGFPSIEKRVTSGGTNYVLRYPCRCDCGTERRVRAFKLLSNSKSCGCDSGRRAGLSRTRHGFSAYKNGTRHRLYRVWDGMTQRCTNPNHDSYPDYGGNGIGVCEAWKSFDEFKNWALTHGYADMLEIDRIENNLGYSPENCRWVTSSVNKINRRTTRFLTAFGECKCATEWALDSRCSVTPNTIMHRINKLGMSEQDAVSEPRSTRKSAGNFVGHHIKSRQ